MAKWRKVNQFLVVSGTGKKQTGLGAFLADAALNTRENCEMEMDTEFEYRQERSCDKVDLVGEQVVKRYRRFRLTYDNPTPQQIFRNVCYKEGAVTSPTGVPANCVMTLTRSGTVSGGTFSLSISDFEGRSGETAQIPYDATAAQIQAAITSRAASLGKVIQPGDVAVAGNWASGITLTFAKRLRNADLPLLVVDNTNITGGGTVEIAETTAGDQNYHTAQRSSDGSKPHFSIATGEKGGSIATRKYGDCAIESIDFTVDIEGASVQMVVVVVGCYIPQEITGFSVPACSNLPGVKTVDVRLKSDGQFIHRDLVNHSISLNDNVPVNAAFAFDDIDITDAFVRGDQPSQDTDTEIFGDENHPLYALAEEAHIEGNEIEQITMFGNPGNRVSITAAETKIKPQQRLEGFSGEANQSTVRIIGTPYGITGIPVTFEAWLDQSTAFLTT